MAPFVSVTTLVILSRVVFFYLAIDLRQKRVFLFLGGMDAIQK